MFPYFVHVEGEGFYSFPFHTFHVSEGGTVSIGDIRLLLEGGKVLGEMKSGDVIIVKSGGKDRLESYRRVRIEAIAEGVDAVVVPINNRMVEIFFEIRGDAAGNSIRIPVERGHLEAKGSKVLLRDPDGRISTEIGDIRAFQGTEEIPVNLVVRDGSLEILLGRYDSEFDVVLDPVFSAVITSTSTDAAFDIEVDPTTGVVYVAGYTQDYTTFAPARNTVGSLGNRDLFISKLSTDLSNHLGTIVIGGTSYEGGYTGVAISRKSNGNLILASYTQDATGLGIPATTIGTPEGDDAIVFEVDSGLSSVIRAMIIGAAGNQNVSDVEILPSGSILLTGTTDSTPSFSVPENISGQTGGTNVYVMSIDSNLMGIQRVSILTGRGNDSPDDMEIGPDGFIYLTGHTDSSSTFANGGPLYGTGPGASFITRLDTDLTPVATVFVGSSSSKAIAVDDSSVYITGSVLDYTLLPSPVSVFGTPSPGAYFDAFVTRFPVDLSSPPSTALIAGSSHDEATDIEISGSSVVIVGNTYSSDISPSRNQYGSLGRSNIFFSRLTSDLSSHIATLIIGGDGNDNPYNMKVFGTQIYTTGDTGPSFGGVSFLGSTVIMGDTFGSFEVFVLSVPATLPVQLKEEPFSVIGQRLVLEIRSPSYVGFEIYTASGKLLRRESPGFLPQGRYEIPLEVEPGPYVLRLRVGERVTTRSIVIMR